MHIDELNYHLPEELIAQEAIEPRDSAKLLVVDRSDKSQTMSDEIFSDLPNHLKAGDCMVLNNTKVLPARFNLRKRTGGRVEALFLREIEKGLWEIMVKGLSKIQFGQPLKVDGFESFDEFDCAEANVFFTPKKRLSAKTLAVEVDPAVNPVTFLDKVGRMPLPPYIQRKKASYHIEKQDAEQYQTVFSERSGAVAAPTAGLHFTPQLLDKIRNMGVKVVSVTLHVGMGTFEPLSSDRLEDHKMHREWYSIDEETARIINQTKSEGNKIIAVGTTSVRVLETVSSDDGQVKAGDGWTNIFIYPPYRFKVVDQLVTNFHLPKTTLLAMIYALATKELTQAAYAHAIANQYRFFSYGDAMLIK